MANNAHILLFHVESLKAAHIESLGKSWRILPEYRAFSEKIPTTLARSFRLK